MAVEPEQSWPQWDQDKHIRGVTSIPYPPGGGNILRFVSLDGRDIDYLFVPNLATWSDSIAAAIVDAVDKDRTKAVSVFLDLSRVEHRKQPIPQKK